MEISGLSLSSLSLQRPDPAQMRAQLFKKTDADSSGTITKQELTDAIANIPKPSGGTGDEAPEVEQMFSAMDTDANGEVTEAEHTSFLEQVDAQRGGQRPPPPPSGGAGGFEGSTDMLSSLLSALQDSANDEETSTDVSALIQKLVDSLKERASSYNADGTSNAEAKSLFETNV
ncbi:MAG: EF-hand domain-containing protein [Opitutaceae bacterium]|nr:EF-hand domain-containing protein [Opitutaceae bacterium]